MSAAFDNGPHVSGLTHYLPRRKGLPSIVYSSFFDEPRRAELIDRECEQLDQLYYYTNSTRYAADFFDIIHNKRRSHRRLAIGLTVLTLDCSPRRHWTWNVYLLINLFKFSLSAFLSMEPLSTGVRPLGPCLAPLCVLLHFDRPWPFDS